MNPNHSLNQALSHKPRVHGGSTGNHADTLTVRKHGVGYSLLGKIRLSVPDSGQNGLPDNLRLLHDFLFHIKRISLLAAAAHVPVHFQPLYLSLVS